MGGWDEDDLAELEALRDEEEGWPDSFGARLVLVCRCHCVEEQEIQALVEEGCGIAEIAARTGATTGCGSCRRQVEAMVAARRRVG